jgi:hypothetical protein
MSEIDPLMLVLIGAAASGLLILLAVGMAYRLGRDRGLRSRSDRFDRLYVEAAFGDTHWTVCDTSDAVTAKVVGTMSLYQSGTRVMAEGFDSQERRWSAEGVAFRRGVHLLFVERRERGHAVGSLHLSLDQSGQLMTGMKSTWEGDKTGGAIQTIVWRRSPSRVPFQSDADVDIEQHALATVANRQQRVNVFRPIDRVATDVVNAPPSPSHSGF